MKKLLIALALVLPVAFAVPAGCVGETAVPTDTGGISYGDWTAAGFSCAQSDKLFFDFSPGAAPANTTLRIMTYQSGGETFHAVMFGGIFQTPFSISYDVVITNQNPDMAFRRVSADLIDLDQQGQPQLVKTVYGLDTATNTPTTLLGGITAYYGTPPAGGCTLYPCSPLVLGGTVRALHIVDTFTPNGGTGNSIGNAYLQGVPEPSTMALFGAGLVALSFLRRRK